MQIDLTHYPNGIYDIDSVQTLRYSWGELKAFFSQHRRLDKKDLSPGFGPYLLQAPPVACMKHKDGRMRQEPHRCNNCVSQMTLLTFDVDKCVMGDYHKVDAVLASLGLARIWYSTYSHTEDRPAFRLLIPITRSVAPKSWALFRRSVIRRLNIPVDPSQCSGSSHYYHLPSCPNTWATPIATAFDGQPLNVDEVLPNLRQKDPQLVVSADFVFEPPTLAEPVDLVPLLEKLQKRLAGLKRVSNETRRATWLHRLLNGEQLEEPGKGRNNACNAMAGLVAYALPGTPLEALKQIMAPSVDVMIAAGSKLTWAKVERMLLTAMEFRARTDALEQEGAARARQAIKNLYDSIPVAKDPSCPR